MSNYRIYAAFTCFFVLHLSIIWVPLTHEPFMLDAPFIIEPLENIDNFFLEYIDKIGKGLIFDFQPVRDITHFIEIKINKNFNFSHTGTYINLVILYLSSFFIFKTSRFFFRKEISQVLSFMFLFHPLVNLVFLEITQRKHILSFLFFIITYFLFLRSKESKPSKLMYLTYALSGLSHPINLLMPIWFYLQEKIKFKKEHIYKYLPFVILLTTITLSNYLIFAMFHYKRVGIDQQSFFFVPHTILFSIGLHFRLFFWPFSYGVFYSLGNISVLIFSFAPFIFSLYLYKKMREQFWFFTIPLALIFLTLYGHRSNVLTIYIQTSYVLTPAFIFLLFCGYHLKGLKFNPFLWLIPFGLGAVSVWFLSHRTSMPVFHRFLYSYEPECRSLQYLTLHYIESNQRDKFKKYGLVWLNEKCSTVGSTEKFKKAWINTHLVFESEDFPFEQKLFLFKEKVLSSQDIIILELGLRIQYRPQDEKKINELFNKLGNHKEASVFYYRSYLGDLIKNSCSSYSGGCEKLVDFEARTSKKNATINFKVKSIPLNHKGDRIIIKNAN